MQGTGHRKTPARWHLILVPALAALPGFSCFSVECKGENESDLFLRSVAIADPAPIGQDIPGDGSGRILSQSWTIQKRGEFILNQTVEKKASVLGIEGMPLDAKSAGRLKMDPFSGILVLTVTKDGPANRGGIQKDDVIITFDGKELTSLDRLQYLVESTGPGKAVEMGILREGNKLALKVELGQESREIRTMAIQKTLPTLDDRRRTGLFLAELTDDVRPYILGSKAQEKGLLVTEILPGGPAFAADLRVRDCITKINGQPVATAADFGGALASVHSGSRVTVMVLRGGIPLEKSLKTDDDAMTSWGFNLLGLVKYKGDASRSDFSLLWNLLYNYESGACVKRSESPQNWREKSWGAVLDLIAVKSTPRKWEMRLAWIFPISFKRNDPD